VYDGFTNQRRHGFGGQSCRAVFSHAPRRRAETKAASPGILGKRLAAPVRHTLLLGRGGLLRTTDMAEDNGDLQGRAAAAGDDGMG
jgi:hypothetical protein